MTQVAHATSGIERRRLLATRVLARVEVAADATARAEYEATLIKTQPFVQARLGRTKVRGQHGVPRGGSGVVRPFRPGGLERERRIE
jgi:hypothetical protein